MKRYKDIVIRPYEKGDIEKFKPNAVFNPTMRAWVGEKNGDVLVIGGIARGMDFRWYAFFDIKDEAREYDILIARFAKQFIEELKKTKIKYIYADIDLNERNSWPWALSLGFDLDPRSKFLARWENKGDD